MELKCPKILLFFRVRSKDWRVSGFVGISTRLIRMAQYYSPVWMLVILSIYHFMEIGVVFPFCPSRIMLPWTLCMSFYVSGRFSPPVHPWNGLVGAYGNTSFLRNHRAVFPIACTIRIPPMVYEGPITLTNTERSFPFFMLPSWWVWIGIIMVCFAFP